LKDVERMAAIGETAGMVGHDIRNPLQSIEGAVYLAKEEMRAMPSKTEPMNTIEEMLDTIHEQTEYVDKIVSDLQDYARPLEPKLEETNIQLLLNNIFAEVDVPLSIDMSIKVEQDCRAITVDPTMTKRILTNLITNAIQAMPNGGTLTIKATKKQEEAVITVQDTGAGIAEGNKHRIFQPMFTTKAKGTGFGLAVVKRLVEAHNGTVTFESQVDKGTAFTITLPTAKVGS
jgi:signal transduction histidine kinase